MHFVQTVSLSMHTPKFSLGSKLGKSVSVAFGKIYYKPGCKFKLDKSCHLNTKRSLFTNLIANKFIIPESVKDFPGSFRLNFVAEKSAWQFDFSCLFQSQRFTFLFLALDFDFDC
ncbi:MAG: hypothetical protein GY718_08610 [Lentisphaerae bacterium]|nr:hypothetical protein [Lentisphaerota bacterium]